jgi:tripartite-type tricarboxylate transporter receptor subunit TctC
MLAPAGTPRDVAKRMSEEVARIIKSDETRAKLDAMGTIPVGSTPEEFDAFITTETAKWGKVIRTAGVKAE